MRKFILIASGAALLWGVACSSNAAEWYETLRPGITRAEILKLVGEPSASDGKMDTYAQPRGRIQCAYEHDILRSAIYYDPPGGGVSWTLYAMEGELNDSDLELRRVYLKNGAFQVLPQFSGREITTQKYAGSCYEVDEGIIVVEPIIDLGGGVGFFADKAARVLWLNSNGAETVLYRAADHWEALKPTGLPEAKAKSRKMKLKDAGERVLTQNVTNVLGESDSLMGSGIDYRLFYIEDGLAIVQCAYPNARIEAIGILRPGLTNLTISEWLSGAQTGAPANADSPHPLMSPFITWLLVVVLVGVPAISGLIWRERRAWLRAASWRCPRCGQMFGPQPKQHGWGVKANPPPRGVATNGPLLGCLACGGKFPFSWQGEFVTHWKIGDAQFSK